MNFYRLEEAWLERAIRIDLPSKHGDPLHGSISEGRDWTDLIGTTRLVYAASRRMVRAITEGRLAGVTFRPLIVEGQPGPLYVAQIDGACGELDVSQATRINAGERNPLMEGKLGLVGPKVTQSTWDGSDFFTPRGTRFIFCSDRAREVLAAAEISNVAFTAVSDVMVIRMMEPAPSSA